MNLLDLLNVTVIVSDFDVPLVQFAAYLKRMLLSLSVLKNE